MGFPETEIKTNILWLLTSYDNNKKTLLWLLGASGGVMMRIWTLVATTLM